MITLERDTPIICLTCNRPAVQRQIEVLHNKSHRIIVYQTHSADLADPNHHATLKRIEKFHAKLHALEAAMNELPPEQLKLESGWIARVVFGNVKPSACEVRTEFIPECDIRAFGFDASVTLPKRPLKGATAAKLLAEFKAAAQPIVERLRKNRQDGDY